MGRPALALTDIQKARLREQYDAREKPLEEIAAAYGRSLGWIQQFARREGWGLRRKLAERSAGQATPLSEDEMARRLFGDLADDILLLRRYGHTVARFRDGFRVDRDVLTAEQLQARARQCRDAGKSTAGPKQAAATSRPPANDALQAERTEAPPARSARWVGRRADTNETCGALDRQGRNPERLPALDGAPASAGQEMKSKRSRPEHRTPPAGCDGPQDIIAERITRIEQRIDFLFTAVAEAVACRRDTLVEQAAGLEQLQASLRGTA